MILGITYAHLQANFARNIWISRTQFRRLMQLNAGTAPLHQAACVFQAGYRHHLWCVSSK